MRFLPQTQVLKDLFDDRTLVKEVLADNLLERLFKVVGTCDAGNQDRNENRENGGFHITGPATFSGAI